MKNLKSQIKIENELEINQNKTTPNIETEISTNSQINKSTKPAKNAQVRQKNFHEEIQDFSELDITNRFMFF